MAWIPASGSGRRRCRREGRHGTGGDNRPREMALGIRFARRAVHPLVRRRRFAGCTNTTTFAEAITAAGIRFEYFLFDDCFMSSIEVAYDLRKITRHLIASPCEVMAYGYPYDLVMPYLFTDGGTEYDLDGVCRSFYEFYEQYEAPKYNCGAIAVTVCGQVEQMAEVMRPHQQCIARVYPRPGETVAAIRVPLRPDAVLRPGGLRLPTVRRHRPAKGIRRTARTHRPRTLPAAYGVFLFGRQAADHDLFGHFDQRAEHERDRGEQYPAHRLV